MLDKILDFIADHLGINHVVEEGASGMWNYRKWSNGVVELWGNKNLNVAAWSAWGGWYASNYTDKTSFPFTFTRPPRVFITYQRNRIGDAVAVLGDEVTTTTLPPLALERPTADNTGACLISVYVRGECSTGGVLN